jgi:serine/threonine protein kinase
MATTSPKRYDLVVPHRHSADFSSQARRRLFESHETAATENGGAAAAGDGNPAQNSRDDDALGSSPENTLNNEPPVSILGIGTQAAVVLGRESDVEESSEGASRHERLVAVKVQPLVDSPAGLSFSEIPRRIHPEKDDVSGQLKKTFRTELTCFRQEVKALKRVKGHPNIASLRDSFILACAGLSHDDMAPADASPRQRRANSVGSGGRSPSMQRKARIPSPGTHPKAPLRSQNCLQVLIFNLEGGSRDLVRILDDGSTSASAGSPIVENSGSGWRIPEERSRTIFAQLLDALIYCHLRGVAHR